MAQLAGVARFGSYSYAGASGRCRLVWWPWLRWCIWPVPFGLVAMATLVQLAGAAWFGGHVYAGAAGRLTI